MITRQGAACKHYPWKLATTRELSLIGPADLGPWERHLCPHGMEPVIDSGCAQVMIRILEAWERGRCCRELSISVAARPQGCPLLDAGIFRAATFHSSRLPPHREPWWDNGVVETSFAGGRLEADLSKGTRFEFVSPLGIVSASMSTAADEGETMAGHSMAGHEGDSSMASTIYLPTHGNCREVWREKVAGSTRSLGFGVTKDRFTLTQIKKPGIISVLAESDFAGQTWVLREQACCRREFLRQEMRN